MFLCKSGGLEICSIGICKMDFYVKHHPKFCVLWQEGDRFYLLVFLLEVNIVNLESSISRDIWCFGICGIHEWFQVQLITFLKCFGKAFGKAKDCELFFWILEYVITTSMEATFWGIRVGFLLYRFFSSRGLWVYVADIQRD